MWPSVASRRVRALHSTPLSRTAASSVAPSAPSACYTAARTRRGEAALPIWAFHGAEDSIIASSLATRSHARLREAGFQNCCLHIAPTLEHCEPPCAEALFFLQALEDFFTAQPPTTRSSGRPSAARLRRRPSPQKARADRDRDMRRAHREQRGSTGRPLQKRQATPPAEDCPADGSTSEKRRGSSSQTPLTISLCVCYRGSHSQTFDDTHESLSVSRSCTLLS